MAAGLMHRRRFPAAHLATAVCAWRGHVAPAARDAYPDPDRHLAVEPPEAGGEWRLVRCLRCDAWLAVATTPPDSDVVAADIQRLEMPRRGRALRSAVILRLIAVERGIHSLLFLLAAAAALALRSDLTGVKSWVRHLLQRFTSSSTGTGNDFGGSFITKEGHHLLDLKASDLDVIIAVALAYCLVEGVEAVGLWFERRWAEYLTVVATAGFVPLEAYELAKSVSVLKITALVTNLVVLVYLLWSKRLFGLARFRPRPADGRPPDPADLLAGPGLVGAERIDPDFHAVARAGGPDEARAGPVPKSS